MGRPIKPNEIEICGEVTKIKLLHGLVTLIDTEDYDRIKHMRWTAHYDQTTRSYYCQKKVNGGGTLHLHRVINKVTDRKIQVDHINHDTLDNRKSNLRSCTQNENQYNSLIRRDNKTGFKGVSFDKKANKYHAGIRFNGKRIHLGYFENPLDASKKYEEKAKELFKSFYPITENKGEN